jgi:diguanylate cyclase (GGDEF)-like protein
MASSAKNVSVLNNKNKGILRYFILLFCVINIIFIIIVLSLYNIELSDVERNLMFKDRAVIELEKKSIQRKLSTIFSDLIFLAGLYKEHFDCEKSHKNNEYLIFCKEKAVYDQVRFIDKNGMEVNRINYNNGTPHIVAEQKLQSKSQRYYFKDTICLNPGQIFVSPLDLNIEKGQVELPLKPMIRVGTPVTDPDGNKNGIVILNYLAADIITSITEIAELSIGEAMLVNSDGYWLYCSEKGNEWGFMFSDRKDRKFFTQFADEWEQIFKKDNAQFISSRGIFTSTTVSPFDTVSSFADKIISSNGSGTAGGASSKSFCGQSYYWKLISFIPDKVIKAQMRRFSLFNLLWLTAAFMVVSGVISWVFVQSVANKKLYLLSLQHMANFDELTAIPNRKLFLDRLTQAMNLSVRNRLVMAVLFIDLDGFKQINDLLGHDAGDVVLRETAKRISSTLRKSDTVARFGGDEFTVILQNVGTLENAKITAKKLLKSLQKPYLLNGTEKSVGASIGVALFLNKSDSEDILLKKADDAMYLAKKSGKNIIKTHDDIIFNG